MSYKNAMNENWEEYINAFPEKLKLKMDSRFNCAQIFLEIQINLGIKI